MRRITNDWRGFKWLIKWNVYQKENYLLSTECLSNSCHWLLYFSFISFTCTSFSKILPYEYEYFSIDNPPLRQTIIPFFFENVIAIVNSVHCVNTSKLISIAKDHLLQNLLSICTMFNLIRLEIKKRTLSKVRQLFSIQVKVVYVVIHKLLKHNSDKKLWKNIYFFDLTTLTTIAPEKVCIRISTTIKRKNWN